MALRRRSQGRPPHQSNGNRFPARRSKGRGGAALAHDLRHSARAAEQSFAVEVSGDQVAFLIEDPTGKIAIRSAGWCRNFTLETAMSSSHFQPRIVRCPQ